MFNKIKIKLLKFRNILNTVNEHCILIVWTKRNLLNTLKTLDKEVIWAGNNDDMRLGLVYYSLCCHRNYS